jgi:predicted anti-sigma-YlaC factor YlaD
MIRTRTTILDRMRGSHDHTRRLLSEHAEGQLRGLTRWRVSRHLARCEPCRALYRSLLATLSDLHRLRATDPERTSELTDDVLERI